MFGKNKFNKEVLIDGMHCMHCAKATEASLKGIDGVSSVKIDLDNKKAVISSKRELTDNEITVAVENAGFSVVEIK